MEVVPGARGDKPLRHRRDVIEVFRQDQSRRELSLTVESGADQNAESEGEP